jgi:predicted dehydrogenase
MKFGLVGTGYWARVTHGAGLARDPGTDLVAVWGRDAGKAAALAADLDAKPYTDFDAFLAEVDAVAFAVPPDTQAELATRAARAGKHLLLDKPPAISVSAAQDLAAAVDRAGVASVVFFTSRFAQSNRDWLAAAAEAGGWEGAWARWIVSVAGTPYAASPWRQAKGALWDVGPHALSMLIGALGPVDRVTADGGTGDLAHLVLQHRDGATSTVTLTLDAPADAINVELSLWGTSGVSTMPRGGMDVDAAFALALAELQDSIGSGHRSHPCDVHFGVAVVRVLAEAEQQIASRRAGA